jgi:RNA polymerase sigma-70 factor (ECF subfamily)
MPPSLNELEALYRTYGSRMKSLAYNLLGNTSDAEDAVQEAFLKAYRGQKAFGGRSAVWTWMYRILINVCYDAGRRRNTGLQKHTVPLEASETRPAPAGNHPLRMTLERLVAELSPRLREVFLLHDVEGLTHGEIATVLGIAEGTSKSALFEARRRLASALVPVGAHQRNAS